MVGRHRLSFHQTVIEFIKPRTSFTGNKFWDKVFDTVSFRRSLNSDIAKRGQFWGIFFTLFDLYQNMLSFAFRFLLIQAFWEGLVDGFSYCFLSFLATFPCLANVWFSRSCKSKGSTRLCRCKFDKLKNPPEFQDESKWILQQKITWIQTSLMGMTWLLFEFLNDLSWT